MTATPMVALGCDRCGVEVETSFEDPTSIRRRLQSAGWSTLRVGYALRDYCAPCTAALAKEIDP